MNLLHCLSSRFFFVSFSHEKSHRNGWKHAEESKTTSEHGWRALVAFRSSKTGKFTFVVLAFLIGRVERVARASTCGELQEEQHECGELHDDDFTSTSTSQFSFFIPLSRQRLRRYFCFAPNRLLMRLRDFFFSSSRLIGEIQKILFFNFFLQIFRSLVSSFLTSITNSQNFFSEPFAARNSYSETRWIWSSSEYQLMGKLLSQLDFRLNFSSLSLAFVFPTASKRVLDFVFSSMGISENGAFDKSVKFVT